MDVVNQKLCIPMGKDESTVSKILWKFIVTYKFANIFQNKSGFVNINISRNTCCRRCFPWNNPEQHLSKWWKNHHLCIRCTESGRIPDQGNRRVCHRRSGCRYIQGYGWRHVQRCSNCKGSTCNHTVQSHCHNTWCRQ